MYNLHNYIILYLHILHRYHIFTHRSHQIMNLYTHMKLNLPIAYSIFPFHVHRSEHMLSVFMEAHMFLTLIGFHYYHIVRLLD